MNIEERLIDIENRLKKLEDNQKYLLESCSRADFHTVTFGGFTNTEKPYLPENNQILGT